METMRTLVGAVFIIIGALLLYAVQIGIGVYLAMWCIKCLNLIDS